MKLSTKGRYAVMAMTDLAQRQTEGPVTLAGISERQGISLSYLEQLFARLRRAGVVQSVRGPGGGYRLAKEASQTSIAAIVVAVDEPLKTTRCKGERGCMPGGERCLTHDLWEALSGQIIGFLSGVTLDDVLKRNLRIPSLANQAA